MAYVPASMDAKMHWKIMLDNSIMNNWSRDSLMLYVFLACRTPTIIYLMMFVYVGTNIGADFELSIATDHISFLAATTVSAAACKLLWVGSSCLKTMQEMGPQSALNSSRALDGVHGVYVLPHAPFVVEEVKELGDQSSTCKNSNSGNHRYLLMQ